MKNREVNTRSTYGANCFRKVADEDGSVRVARMQETRAISVTLTTHEGSVFHKGARIA